MRYLHMSILSYLKHGLLPATCIFCLQKSTNTRDICQDCLNNLPWLAEGCQICAYPLSTVNQLICGLCLRQAVPYQRTLALFAYYPPIDRLIADLKFNDKLLYAKILGDLLADKVIAQNRPLPTLLLPVPLHKNRLKERGYNQALELARVLKRVLSIPIDSVSCQRIRATVPQTSLTAERRLNNVKGAFSLVNPILAKHVAIIDDVVTTGHTVAEISYLLRRQGIEQIEVWCCARTFLTQ